MRAYAILSAYVALGVAFAEGRVLNSLDQLSTDDKYDFIVIGSGPGGSAVAARLSENPRFKVLLVEAGGNNEGILNITIPARHESVNSIYSWEYESTPQIGLNNRTVVYHQGRVLGGGSSINGQVYTRGSADDFNHYAKVTGDNGWAWDSLVPYFKKNERWEAPPGGRNDTGEYDPRVHGTNGNIGVSLSWTIATNFVNRCVQRATTAVEAAFKFNLDYNSGKPLGLGWSPWTVSGGERSSAATGYLTPAVRERPNLTILLNTNALRALQVGQKKSLDFRTVELGTVAGEPTKKITATKEVILSTGAFGTPHFLLNSGIGDKNELKKVGVTATHHLPDVGKNLQDHIGIIHFWLQLQPTPPVDQDAAFQQWQQSRTGPLAEPQVSKQLLWARIPSNSTIWKKYKDPAPGPSSPHIEIIPVDGSGVAGGIPVLLTPYSRGSVTIGSSNAFQRPIIDNGFLTHPFDVEAIKEGIRLIKRFFSGPVWDGYLGPLISSDPDSDPDFVAKLRDGAFWFWHPVGTAAMSARGAKTGVVDPDLKVKGVKGLRVVCSAALPKVPAAHTQVPTYVLAERASDLIKRAWPK